MCSAKYLHHNFRATPYGGAGVSPVFASTSHDGRLFSLYQKKGAVAFPNGSTKDVAWLQLEEIQEGSHGGISTAAFRVHTAGGQPPTSVGGFRDRGTIVWLM
jgi:hypothetical protein